MSVFGSTVASVIPIYREPPLLGVNPSIMGRWLGRVNVTGDLSGGAYSISIALSSLVNLFGSRTMWDLKFFNLYYSAALVNPFCQLLISPNEPNNALVLTMGYWLELESTTILSSKLSVNPVQDMKFEFQYQQAQFPTIGFVVSPNTNAVTVICAAGGYVYDEKYI